MMSKKFKADIDAVLETLNDNYVRSNEANKSQSLVATKGRIARAKYMSTMWKRIDGIGGIDDRKL